MLVTISTALCTCQAALHLQVAKPDLMEPGQLSGQTDQGSAQLPTTGSLCATYSKPQFLIRKWEYLTVTTSQGCHEGLITSYMH